MGYKSNIKELEDLKKSAPKDNKGMIQTLLELYRDRKIPQFRTVELAVNRLSLRVKSKAIQAKALKDFEALTKKYMDALPARTHREVHRGEAPPDGWQTLQHHPHPVPQGRRRRC